MPVRYATGQIEMVEDDLNAKAFGVEWGHTRSYANVLSNNAEGVNGNSWLVQQFKTLSFIDPVTGPNDPSKIVMVDSSIASPWFSRPAAGVARGKFGELQQLTHDAPAREFKWSTEAGKGGIFYDNSGGDGEALVGKLKAVIDNAGRKVAPDYDAEGKMTRFAQVAEGKSSVFSYEHYDAGGGAGRLAKAQLDVDGQAVRRAKYAYFDAEPGGNAGDLKSVSVEQFDGAKGQWGTIAQKHYRYYSSGDTGGFAHGLKYVVKDATYQRMSKAGLNPETATEAQVASYADFHFEYDDQQRIVKERVNGGRLEINFGYLPNPAEPTFAEVNTWAMRTIESFPNGTENRVYTNKAGQLILKIFRDNATGDEWYSYAVYNTDYQMVRDVSSAAVDSVVEPSSGNGWTLTVNLQTNSGLIREQIFYTPSDTDPGEVPGYLQARTVRQGTSGVPVTLSSYTYDTHAAFGGVEIHPLLSETNYPTPSTPATTSCSYTWHVDENGDPTFQVKEKITTFPVVEALQNGSGVAGVERRIFDIEGHLIWLMDVREAITYMTYDPATGALTQKIEDVDTERMGDVPSSWVTQPGWGLHLITDYLNDGLGREVQARGPWHEVQLRESDTEATSIRRVQFTAYLDAAHETRQAMGYLTGDGPTADLRVVGAVSLTRTNASGSITDEIQCPRTCTCGPLSTGECFPQAKWSRWKKTIYDPWNRLAANRVYHLIPAEGEGSAASNYLETIYTYDEMNRRVRVIDPSVTIHRSVYDVRGLVVSEWTGTDDRGATNSNPTGDGSPGNNMVLVSSMIYDGGTPGGNGNLTRLTKPVDDESANNRVTTFTYDFRDQLISTTRGTKINVTAYDDLGRPTSETVYSLNIAPVRRIALSRTFYDALGRVYRNEKDRLVVGSVTATLVGQNWFDLGGNMIKTSKMGVTYFIKTVYDSLSRPTASYFACIPGEAGIPPGDDNNVGADTVIEQNEEFYDPAGNRILSVRRQRFDDASGTGPLKNVLFEPKARVNYVGLWPDSVGRARILADFGTNGGAILVRPSVAPGRSNIVLVTTNRFKEDGEATATIDPQGIETRWENDQAGRRVKLIENFVPGAPEKSRISVYAWHGNGNLGRLTLSNSVAGEQVTQWVYGTTQFDSLIADNNLLRAKIYPESDDRPAPIDAGPDGVYARLEYTYNRQGEVATFNDADGTARKFTYDIYGQRKVDAVTNLAPGVDGSILRLEWVYDLLGNITTATSFDATSGGSVVNQVTLTYDSLGNLGTDQQSHYGVTNASTPKVSYTYTNGIANTNRRNKIVYPNGQGLNVQYGAANSIDDHLNRVSALQVTGAGETLVSYSYVGVAWQVGVGYAEPAIELSYRKQVSEPVGDAGDPYNGYDRFGRTVDMRWQSTESERARLERIQYGFDRASKRTWYKRAFTDYQDQAYEYDGISQVVQASRGNLNLNLTAISGVPVSHEQWSYDSVGNWKGYRVEVDGSITLDQHRTYDKGNRLTQIDGALNPIVVDQAGRTRQLSPDASGDWSKSLEVTWDAWSRIVKVKQDSDEIGAYSYDGLFRRQTRTVDAVTWHSYYSLSWHPIEERRDNQTTAAIQYYWGARHRDDLVRRDRATTSGGSLVEIRYVLMDYYSPVAVTNEAGEVKERYSFSAFGLREILQPDFQPRATSECAWDFSFHGQFVDPESGLFNYGYRYYSPQLGRWLSKDPLNELDDENLYAFVENCPASRQDFLGLAATQRNCTSLIDIGHTGNITNGLKTFWGSPEHVKYCDMYYGVSCGGFAPNGGAVWASEAWKIYARDRNDKRYKPDDTWASKELSSKISQAEKDAEAQCKRKDSCCKTVNISTKANTDDEAVKYAMADPYFAKGYKYRNTLNCATGQWSMPKFV